MRKVGPIILGMLVASSFAPAARAQLPGQQSGQVAFSTFTTSERGRPTLFMVGAIVLDQQIPQTFALIGRMPCRTVIRHDKKKLSCSGSLDSVTATPPDLFVDPALRNAHLNVDYKGTRTVVDWTSRNGTPGPEWQAGSFDYAGLYANARASGSVLGQKFSSDKEPLHVYSYMLEYASVYVSAPGIEIWQDAGGAFRVHALLPARP